MPSGVNSHESTRSPVISEFGAFSKVDAICLKRKLWTCCEEVLVVLLCVRCGSSVSGVPLICRRKVPPGMGMPSGAAAAATSVTVGVAVAGGAVATGVAAGSSSSSPQPIRAAAARPAPPITPPRSAARREMRVRQKSFTCLGPSVMFFPPASSSG